MQKLNIDQYRASRNARRGTNRPSRTLRRRDCIRSTLKCSARYVGTRVMEPSAYQYTKHIMKDALRYAMLQKYYIYIPISGKFYVINGLYKTLRLEDNRFWRYFRF